MVSKGTQKAQIIRYMKIYGSISSLEATNELKIMSLSRRLTDLHKDGYVFKKTWHKGAGQGTSYLRYSILQEPKEANNDKTI